MMVVESWEPSPAVQEIDVGPELMGILALGDIQMLAKRGSLHVHHVCMLLSSKINIMG